MGTVFAVDGNWYLRLVGEGGNLVRIEAERGLLSSLTENARVEIDGEISRAGDGRIIACIARAIHRIDDSVPSDEQATFVASEDWKKRVLLELEKDEPDWKIIETASRNAVDSDPHAVRFSVDAAHIQRLGEQLVGRQETALSELIKNGFDADATTVTLTFENQRAPGGTLVINDDGLGMVAEVIRSSWMRISTNTKSLEPRSPRYGRVRAGKKGIGRFAVQRLGRRLVMETRPFGQVHGYRVTFDWDVEFTAGRDLYDVFSTIERFDKPAQDHGTILRILDLRDGWSPAAIDRVWRAVVLLQPPFDLSDQAEPVEAEEGAVTDADDIPPAADGDAVKPTDEGGADPGFRVTINGVSQNEQEELFSIEKSFLSLALARITATIDADGVAAVHLVSDKLDLDDRATHPEKFLLTGPARADARYFIYLGEFLSGVGLDVATRMGREFGGIRIYRNGFRVLPYGEPKDDWLGFDADAARRSTLLPASNRNFFGEIRLTADSNPLFEETSSREGLLENEAFLELRSFVRWAFEWAVTRIGEVRKRKIRANERDFVPVLRRPSEIIRGFRDNRAGPSDLPPGSSASGPSDAPPPGNTLSDEELAAAEAAAIEYEQRVEAARQASLEYEEMLRILASLGLSISVFGHEVKGARSAMASNLILMKDVIEELPDSSERAELDERQAELARASDRLFDIGGYIAGLMTSTETRALRDLSVLGAVERFAKQFDDYMKRQNVNFAIDVDPPKIRTTPMHASELDSVMLNFLTNSIKSMAKARVPSRNVRLEGRLEDEHILIAFEDNGVGIPEADRDRIFNAFFTTTGGSEEDGVAGPGTGLGLKIVSDIASSYGGSVQVGTPSEGYTCRIEFRVLAKAVPEKEELQ